MENELLNAFSSSITVVSSLVAIAAVTICSILTAIITQRGAKKAKQTELLFREMTTAYYDYLRVSDEFSDPKDVEQLIVFSNAATRALLFASTKTQRLLVEYGTCVSALATAKKSGDPRVMLIAERTGVCKGHLIKSMRKDLRK